MSDKREMQVTVLATSDVHGHLLPIRYVDNKATEYGLVKLASIIQKVREERERVLLIDNGDLLQGTPLAYYHAVMDEVTPHPIVGTMNALRLDAFVPGNHEFNYGQPFLRRAWQQSEYPWLSANVLDERTREPYFGVPYRIIEMTEGFRIGLLGLTTAYIPNWEQPANIEGFRFESATEAAKRWVPYVREQGAHVVIVSYHGGFERDVVTGDEVEEQTGENEGWRICREVEGIDLLITGHQHQRIEGVRIGNTWTVQPGYQGSCIAKIELTLVRGDNEEQGGNWKLESIRSELLEAGEAEPDKALIARVQTSENNTQRWLDKPLCEVRGEMRVIDHAAARLTEHPLVELINKIQMEATGAEISCTSLFDNLAPGFGPLVSMREVTANYPFPNTLKVLRLSGRDIREALEWTAMYFAQSVPGGSIEVNTSYLLPKPQHFNYDMWEGIEYGINVSRPAGSRVENLLFDGSPLEPHREIDVVMNHYRASGGGNYRMFRGKTVVREVTVDMTEIIAAYLTKAGIVEAGSNGNWRVYS
ncbi:bifunctional metallophosphatase/5'-nucleotidase [Cohnella endophytica]|uniref:Bifunctional metallophosphatase/5'-nucleotidase n=1 Tax=Cohnella endophytica TaxID=2419778 RepID=A0A494X1P3_9BACL|nr:bifunctional UDP-sugar hydrolase/5'-nucleotidase [Cohnella endophytica]RKP44272.1 bifunctional metallophosphatase/5'-nucleotidase [Cohnella endophytica]